MILLDAIAEDPRITWSTSLGVEDQRQRERRGTQIS